MGNEVLVDYDGTLCVLTLNRPERRNAFTADSYRQLAEALRSADADLTTRAVVVRGAGQGFCSGVDLEALAADSSTGLLAPAFDMLLEALVEIDVPLLGAVHGAAIGVGATMLLHFDYVVSANDAKFRFPFAPMGILPEAASSWTLPRLVGPQRGAELLLSGRFFSGAEAVQFGMVAECVAQELVEIRAREVAAGICEHEREVLRSTKRLLREPHRADLAGALARERTEGASLAQRLSRP